MSKLNLGLPGGEAKISGRYLSPMMKARRRRKMFCPLYITVSDNEKIIYPDSLFNFRTVDSKSKTKLPISPSLKLSELVKSRQRIEVAGKGLYDHIMIP